jgi:hypothetical protein
VKNNIETVYGSTYNLLNDEREISTIEQVAKEASEYLISFLQDYLEQDLLEHLKEILNPDGTLKDPNQSYISIPIGIQITK